MKALLTLVLLVPTLNFAQNSNTAFLIPFMDSTSGNELFGYKTTTGKVVIPAKYYMAFTDTMYKIAFVADKFRLLVINRRDSVLFEPYNFDNGPDYLSEGLFRYVDKGKMGFSDLNGKKRIPARFDFVSPFKNGLSYFAVGGHKETEELHRPWVGGKWGCINKKGEIVIKPDFASIPELIKHIKSGRKK